jgi:protein TonB
MRKIVIITLLAGLITFSLFGFMTFLISSDKVSYSEPEEEFIIDVASLPDERPAENKPKTVITPPTPPIMPKTTTVAMETNEGGPELHYSPIGIEIDTSTINTLTMGTKADGDARPLVRVNPKYPIGAARDGIEGWVVLAFDINAIGEVINIKIIDSQPKRIFDKAAKQALKKWKYRAKSVDGKQVEQQNFNVQLDFTMSQQS